MGTNMMTHIKKIQDLVSPPKITENIVANDERLYMFFSIDICNSTQMKETVAAWFEATKLLYNEQFQFMHFWKYNGDEVLYAEPFSTVEAMAETISQAYIYIKSVRKAIQVQLMKARNQQASVCVDGSKCKKEDNVDQSAYELFNLKGAFWIARTNRADGDNTKNLFVKSAPFDEFLGINIDEGFRISKKVSGSKLVIDSKIMFLLLLAQGINENDVGTCDVVNESSAFWNCARSISGNGKKKLDSFLRCCYFANYSNLKGVWGNKGYPIFWYYQDIEADCDYDEQIDDNFVTPTQITKEWLQKLNNIYKKVKVRDEFVNILDYVGSSKRIEYRSESFSRLYYSVACLNPVSGKVLIAKRSLGRKHLKNVWEFSSFKHTTGSVVDSLEKRFDDEFGVKIKLCTDEEAEANLVPLHFCTIYRNGQAHNSILCTGEFLGSLSDSEIINRIKSHVDADRFADFRFVDIEDIAEYTSIDLKDIETDSFNALSDLSTPFAENVTAMYFKKSVKAVINYHEKKSKWYE